MKSNAVLVSLVVGSLCMTMGGPSYADNISNQPVDPSKHHHYDNPAEGTSYGTDNSAGGVGTDQTQSAGEGASPSYQGHESQSMNKVKSVMGMKVSNKQGQELGEVKDVVI